MSTLPADVVARVNLLGQLPLAFPRQSWPKASLLFYAERFRKTPLDTLAKAIAHCIDHESEAPTIYALRCAILAIERGGFVC